MSDSLLVNALASATSGLIARLACYPLDTAKALVQADDSVNKFSQVVRRTWVREGIRGFYRGVGVVIVGGIPGVCIYLTSYEQCRDVLLKESEIARSSPFAVYLASGMVAEAACCGVFIPVDVIKERLQVQGASSSLHRYNGSLDAFRTILREEGLRGLYKGYAATVYSFGPFSAIYFGLFETIRGQILSRREARSTTNQLSFSENLLSSAAASGAASFITNPLDMGKLRYQIQPANIRKAAEGQVIYRSMMHATLDIYQKFGWRGLFRGAWTRIMFHTPAAAITMALYEECKMLWSKVL